MLKDMETLKQENERFSELYTQTIKALDAKESEIKSLRRDIDSL
jgi:hypothetical protein